MTNHITLLTITEQCEHLQLCHALRNARNTLHAWEFQNTMAKENGKPQAVSDRAIACQRDEVDAINAKMVALEDKADALFYAMLEEGESVK